MNIDRVYVKGLFNDFNHDLSFEDNERIMILTGPNGSGKTTILKLLDILFNQPLTQLLEIPFQEIGIAFDNKKRLIVERVLDTHHEDEGRLPLNLTLHWDGEKELFKPPRAFVDIENLGFPLSAIEEYIPILDRVDRQHWFNPETGDMLDLYDVLVAYPDRFPTRLLREVMPIPDWLQGIKRSINVRFIETERLTRTSVSRHWRHRRTMNTTRTISHYSRELAGRIQRSIANYGALSQKLDRTFPSRLVTNQTNSRNSIEGLRKDLAAIEEKRQLLEESGLLAEKQRDFNIPDLSGANNAQRNVLTVYADDAKEKLAVFDDLYNKVSAFKRIVNSRFSRKQVSVNEKGLFVSKDGETALKLEMLSSGEQHELVMLYELFFRASSNSLILIDEPEISLHVAWQEKWLDDLEEASKLSNFRAIVATHSPEIIGHRRNLIVELSGTKDD